MVESPEHLASEVGERAHAGSMTEFIKFLRTRIPRVTASELGFYRVVFGLIFLFTFNSLRLPPDSWPQEFHLRNSWLADWAWLHSLATQPFKVEQLQQWITWALVLFTIGLLTRPAYWCMAAGLVVWTLVRLQRTGAHPWAVALVTIVCLLPVRWGDGFSVDEMVRRWLGRGLSVRQRGRAYGFALWIPGLVFGTAMAAAGSAKLRSGGLEWITAGTVKYYFVTDARYAPVDWGLWIASHHPAAVLFSFLAVATELSMAAAPVFRSYRARLPFAVAGFGLLLGFHLFQNERWWAWWMLWAMFYIPWPGLFRLIRRAIPAHVVLIDGECARCRLTARIIGGLDWFNRLRFEALQDERITTRRGLAGANLLDSMHAVGRDGRVTRGFRAYLSVGTSLPILWPLLPLGALLLIGDIGERIYARIARSRKRKPIDRCDFQLARKPSTRVTALHGGIALFVIAIQVVASAGDIELEPLMSSYPMYSSTYASIEDFESKNPIPPFYSFSIDVDGQDRDVTALVESLELDELFRDELTRLDGRVSLTPEAEARLHIGIDRLEAATGLKQESLSLKVDQRAFDWRRGIFYWKKRGAVVGTLLIPSLEFKPGQARQVSSIQH